MPTDNGITLIYDRTQTDVNKIKALNAKGWANMTADEKAYYLSGVVKGAYNAADINRVSTAQVALKEYFNTLPSELREYRKAAIDGVIASLEYDGRYYDFGGDVLPKNLEEVSYECPVEIEAVKTDWTAKDYPGTVADEDNNIYDIGYYLANVDILREVLQITAPGTPESLENLTYIKANDIEKILAEIYNAYTAYRAGKRAAIDEAKETKIKEQHTRERSWVWSGEACAGEV